MFELSISMGTVFRFIERSPELRCNHFCLSVDSFHTVSHIVYTVSSSPSHSLPSSRLLNHCLINSSHHTANCNLNTLKAKPIRSLGGQHGYSLVVRGMHHKCVKKRLSNQRKCGDIRFCWFWHTIDKQHKKKEVHFY